MKRTAATLLLVLVSFSLSGCVTVTRETTASMSNEFLCEMLGPMWAGTQEERLAIREELNRRGVICDYGRIVGYREVKPAPTLPQPAPVPQQPAPEIKQYADSKAVEIAPGPEFSFSSGSGFFVSEDGYFVTNHHVIEGAEAIVLMDINSKKYEAEVVRIDEANDIAVLKANGKFKALPVVSSRTAKRGMDVVTVGFPHADIQGVEPKVTQGIINSLSGLGNDARHFQISVPLQAGNSGGPLVTMEGNAIGVVAMKLSALAVLKETGDLPQNVNYAIKSNYLAEVLIGIPGLERKLLPQSGKAYKNVAELTNAVEGATALVIAAVQDKGVVQTSQPPKPSDAKQALPKSYSETEVLNAIRQGFFRNDGGYIRAPDLAENGAIVPAEVNLSTPLGGNECVYLFVNDIYLSHKVCVKGNVKLTLLSVRVRIASTSPLLVAVVNKNGEVFSFEKTIKIGVGGFPPDQSNLSSNFDTKFKVETKDGQGVIKMLVNSPMTTSDYLKNTAFRFGQGNSIDIEMTPWASGNPYVGINVFPPPGIHSVESDLVTSRGEVRSYRGSF